MYPSMRSGLPASQSDLQVGYLRPGAGRPRLESANVASALGATAVTLLVGLSACGTSEPVAAPEASSASNTETAAAAYPEWVAKGTKFVRAPHIAIHGIGANVDGPAADEIARDEAQRALETLMSVVLKSGSIGKWPSDVGTFGTGGTEASREFDKWRQAELAIEANIRAARRYSHVTDRFHHSNGITYVRAQMELGPVFEEMLALGEPGALLVELATERLDDFCQEDDC